MSKKLIAYFSASGVTAKVARELSTVIQADLYEIKPAIPYTSADLDWQNTRSRSSLEMRDKTYRPVLADQTIDIGAYDTVLLGFPIWWYVAPTLINTFLESHDFSGKKILLFATSGSSGFGKTVEELKGSVAADTEIREGKVLNSRRAFDEFVGMIESL